MKILTKICHRMSHHVFFLCTVISSAEFATRHHSMAMDRVSLEDISCLRYTNSLLSILGVVVWFVCVCVFYFLYTVI